MMEIRPMHWTAALSVSLAIHIFIVQIIYSPAGTETTGSQGIAVRLSTFSAGTEAVKVSAESHNADPGQSLAVVNNPKPLTAPPLSPGDSESRGIPSTLNSWLADVEPATEAAASPTETASEEIDTASSIAPPPEVVTSRPGTLGPASIDTVNEAGLQDIPTAEVAVTSTVATTAVGIDRGDSSNAGGPGSPDSGRSGIAEDYYAGLAIWLGRHKRYPRLARRGGQEGTVEVEFVIDKSGRLLRHRIVASSGFELLDEEAYALIERAAPMPPVPEEMDPATLTITTPISFSLR